MDSLELNDFAASWIRMHRAEVGSDEYEKEFWSYEQLDGLCRRNPSDAWSVIVEVFKLCSDDKIVSNLAAGPLEDLFVNHGRLALTWADRYCESESGFVDVLRMVWQNSMPEEIWSGLQELISRRS